jgi:hypothetical protein
MNQALSQKKESTDTDKEKQIASILASVSRSQSTINTSSTQQLIQKYKLTSQSDTKKIVEVLAQESVNQILSQFMKSGKIEEKNGTYYYGGKEFTQKLMKETIMKSFKNDIQQVINKKFENIKLELKKQANNDKKKINNQERVIIASNIASLKTQLKTQEQVIEKKTEQYLSALYKQNKAQSEQRKEKAQLEANRALQIFQQDTLSGKDKQLTQGYQNQQVQLNQQRLQIDQAKQKQDQHIQNLQAQYESDLQKQKQYEQKQIQQQQQHNQIIQQQNEIAARNDQNIKNQIDAAKANNDALIAANAQLTQAQIDANAQLTQAQIDANAQNTQAVIANATDAANANLKALQSLGANISGLQSNFDALSNQFKDLNANMTKIGDKIDNPPPPPTPSAPPAECSNNAVCNEPWHVVYSNARSLRKPNDGPITIWFCSANYHFCASNGETDGNRAGASLVSNLYKYFDINKDLNKKVYKGTGWDQYRRNTED